MLERWGHLKLVDFGFSCPLDPTAAAAGEDTQPMSPTGSLLYISPELLRERSVGASRTDGVRGRGALAADGGVAVVVPRGQGADPALYLRLGRLMPAPPCVLRGTDLRAQPYVAQLPPPPRRPLQWRGAELGFPAGHRLAGGGERPPQATPHTAAGAALGSHPEHGASGVRRLACSGRGGGGGGGG